MVEQNRRQPFDLGKAWREMAHRYIAGLLGLLIAALAGAVPLSLIVIMLGAYVRLSDAGLGWPSGVRN